MTKRRKMKRITAAPVEKTIKKLYDDFQLDNSIKNLSEMTIRFYVQNLIHFFRFTDELTVASIAVIDKKLVDHYIMALKQKGLKDTTINT
ncbi:site-specific integrase [Bacillus sp. JJ1532]|uniref:site-specific integrase n=1 Tax=Bacillus sp. JJ1532 TaxID=3122958 RepID=UPI002FFDBD9A